MLWWILILLDVDAVLGSVEYPGTLMLSVSECST